MTESKIYSPDLKYAHITGNGTFFLLDRPGELVQVVASDSVAVLAIYDDIVAGVVANTIAIIVATTADKTGNYIYKIPLERGLTVTTVAFSGDATVIYR